MDWIKRHQLLIIAISLVLTWLRQATEFTEAAWALFADDPMVPTLSGKVGVDVADLSWITLVTFPIGLVLLLAVLYSTRRKSPDTDDAGQPTPRVHTEKDSGDPSPTTALGREHKLRPTAIRLKEGASNAFLEDITGVGDIDLIDNEGAPSMHAKGVHLRQAVGVPDAAKPDSSPRMEAIKPALTQDQIVERQLFIVHLRSAALRLEKNTHYNIPGSAAQRFNEFCGTPQAREAIQEDEMTGWVSRLVNGQFTALAMRCWDSEQRSDELRPSNLSDEGMRYEVGRIATSVREYRQLIVEVVAFIQALEKPGVPPLRENLEGLADDYDELMQLMKDLRNATTRNVRSGLPTDEQLTKFPRLGA